MGAKWAGGLAPTGFFHPILIHRLDDKFLVADRRGRSGRGIRQTRLLEAIFALTPKKWFLAKLAKLLLFSLVRMFLSFYSGLYLAPIGIEGAGNHRECTVLDVYHLIRCTGLAS